MAVPGQPPCAGIIVFSGNQTILVNTERGNYSFPKGKRTKEETDITAAWRELQEETGLTHNDINLIEGVYFDEKTKKGNLSVRYFVGYLTTTHHRFTFDTTELAHVDWYSVDNVLKLEKLKGPRKEILVQAYQAYEAYMLIEQS